MTAGSAGAKTTTAGFRRGRPALLLAGTALLSCLLGAASPPPAPLPLFGPIPSAEVALRSNPVYVAPPLTASLRQVAALRAVALSAGTAMCVAELPDDAAVAAYGTPDQVAEALRTAVPGPAVPPDDCVVLVGDRLGASAALLPASTLDGCVDAAQRRFPGDPQAALAALAGSVRDAVATAAQQVRPPVPTAASGTVRTTDAGNQVTPGIDGGSLSPDDYLAIGVLALVVVLLALAAGIAGGRTGRRGAGPGDRPRDHEGPGDHSG